MAFMVETADSREYNKNIIKEMLIVVWIFFLFL